MAKHRWIKTALKGAHGQFKAKAEAAGKSTREFASEHAGDSGKTGKQARLAQTLMGMHHKEGGDVDTTSSDLSENQQRFIRDTIMADRQRSPASHAKGGKVKRVGRYAEGGQVDEDAADYNQRLARGKEITGQMKALEDRMTDPDANFSKLNQQHQALANEHSALMKSTDLHHAHGGAVTHLAKAAARYGAKTVRRPA